MYIFLIQIERLIEFFTGLLITIDISPKKVHITESVPFLKTIVLMFSYYMLYMIKFVAMIKM